MIYFGVLVPLFPRAHDHKRDVITKVVGGVSKSTRSIYKKGYRVDNTKEGRNLPRNTERTNRHRLPTPCIRFYTRVYLPLLSCRLLCFHKDRLNTKFILEETGLIRSDELVSIDFVTKVCL